MSFVLTAFTEIFDKKEYFWLQLCDFVLSMHRHTVSGDFVLVSELNSHFYSLELDTLRFFYPLELYAEYESESAVAVKDNHVVGCVSKRSWGTAGQGSDSSPVRLSRWLGDWSTWYSRRKREVYLLSLKRRWRNERSYCYRWESVESGSSWRCMTVGWE